MNICFRVRGGNLSAEKGFLDEAKVLGFPGLAGHRSVNCVKMSNYDSVSIANIRKLADYLIEFAKR